MLSLRTSQAKDMNTSINYHDLIVFIETSFHKREGKIFLELGWQESSQSYRDYTSNSTLLPLAFLFYAHLAIAMTEYVNQNPIELCSFVCVYFPFT